MLFRSLQDLLEKDRIILYISRPGTKPGHMQAILKACNYFQSCMFYILKVFKTKTYLCVAILLLLLFLVVSLSLPPNMAYSQTYLVMYQAHKHHYLITPPYTSPCTNTPKLLFWKNKASMKKPVERWDLVHGRLEGK